MKLVRFAILVALFQALNAHAAKKNVCTITINSSHEKKVLQKYLPSRDFEFIELLPSSSSKGVLNDHDSESIPDWLDNACREKIECDMLVISGHFGGTFFGSSGYKLSLEQLERAACNPDCAGLFKKPKETFLFGCNTLAGKKPDHRTPEQYLQVLLEDHMNLADAEQTVALRYSPWGNENLQRMQGVFSGSAKIYGFDSVGPRGENVEAMLSRHFKSRGPGYSAYLDRLTKKSEPNQSLKTALASTSFLETNGVEQTSSPAICYLNDAKVSRISKVQFVERSLNGPNPLHYAPAIANWISELKDKNFKPEELQMLDRVASNSNTRDRFVTLASAIKNLPVLQASLWEFTMHMRWITEAQFKQKLVEAIRPYFADLQITRTERDTVCGIANTNENFRVKLNRSDLGVKQLTPDMATALACLGNSDVDLVRFVENSLESSTKDVRENAAIALFALSEAGYRGFSYETIHRALKRETDQELKLSLALLEGRAEGDLDLQVYWARAIAELDKVDLSDAQAAAQWYARFTAHRLTAEAMSALLNRIERLDSSKIEDITAIAFIQSALFSEKNDLEELVQPMLNRQKSEHLRRNLSVYIKSFEGDVPNPAGTLKFWSRIFENATDPGLRELAQEHIDRLRAQTP